MATFPGGYQKDLVSKARQIAQEHLRPWAGQVDREARFPEAGLQELSKQRFWGLTVPEEHGGLGANLLTTVMVLEALAQECASTGMCFKMHLEGLNPLAHLTTPDQAQRFLRPIAEGKLFVGVAANEPGGGIQTVAQRVEGGYRVEAACKAFVTSSHFAHLFSFTARSDPATRDIMSFIVERDKMTCEVEGAWDGLGMRGNDSCAVTFTGLIPEANVVASPAAWRQFRTLHIPFVYLTYAAVYLGIAQGALDEARRHATQRTQQPAGRSLAQIETVQRHFGEMAVSVERTRSLVYRAAALVDEDGLEGQELVMAAAVAADETAVEVTERAMLVGGGIAYAKGNALERYLRDARAGPIMVPQDDITKLALGRAILGVSQ